MVPILILRDCFYLKQALQGYVYYGKIKLILKWHALLLLIMVKNSILKSL